MRASRMGWLLGVLLIAACGDDAAPPPVSTIDPMEDGGQVSGCIDNDGDGAGRRCPIVDCDDNDPDITDECTRCNGPGPEKNCPCDEGSEPVLCHPSNKGERIMRDGRLLECVDGAFYCRQVPGVEEFVWSDCEGVFRLVTTP